MAGLMSADAEQTPETQSTWEEAPIVDAPDAEDALIVDVQGYEGPLDLLLALARTQKVDLSKISVLALADQYLGFIAEAQKVRLELAADYLVMAAWLAFLKSRLLLPREETKPEELSGEEMARRLSFRLMRLNAMREAAAQLMNRMRLGRDVFARTMHGAVWSIPIAVVVVACAVAIGSALGAGFEFFGGWLDTVIMRLVDITCL